MQQYTYLTFLIPQRNSETVCLYGATTGQRYVFTTSQPTLRVDSRDAAAMIGTGLVQM
jgi:hypothetical protein